MVKLDQMFVFQHSLHCGPHTFFASALQCLDSCGKEALILIFEKKILNCRLWPHQRSDTAFQPSGFFHVREQKIVRWCQIRRMWRPGWSTSSKPQSRTAAIAITDMCARELSWWNRTPLRSVFQAVHEMFLVLLFKVLNYLSSVDLSGMKQCS